MEDPSGRAVSKEELQLATRNHGLPLEALRYSVTPIGLHFLLVHFDIPEIDADAWRLRVDGCVERPLELSLAELRAMPTTTEMLTMECAGNGRALLEPRAANQPWLVEAVGTGQWTGVALASVLDAAVVQDSAVEILFTGSDRGIEGGIEQNYQRSLTTEEARSSGALLVYELNGVPLPPQHGFPLRLVVPGWYGMTNVKWLSSITAVDAPFTGYLQASAYRLRKAEDIVGEPVTRMLPRALLAPPGIPDFFTRVRTVMPGPCVLMGRAWSGFAPIAVVEMSSDGGTTWSPAELDREPARAGTWAGWRYEWFAEPGEHELCCRATDAQGNTQPVHGFWNLDGYTNNAIQRVRVVVTKSREESG